MRHRNNIPQVIALVTGLLSVHASSAQEALVRKADRLYERFSFAEAIAQYELAFEKGADDLGAARRLADSYRRVREVGKSERWYALIVDAPEATPEDLYNYADALRSNGKYTSADSVMHRFAVHAAMDSRAERQGSIAETYGLLLVDPMFEGNLEPVTINSDASDMAPALLNGSVVFASSRPSEVGITRKHAWDNKPFLNLYKTEGEHTTPLKGTVNTRYHESNATFSQDGKEMFFTRNSYLDGKSEEGADGFNNLHIYSSRSVNGSWTDERSFPFNNASWSTGHPCLSVDGRTLFFSSDRPGGFGGVDIWRSDRDGAGQWGEPVNLGALVNTEGNEMFPTVHGANTLFFASDGHAGLGGLDLYLTWIHGGQARPPVNLGAPVNSRWDDMSFTLGSDDRTGWFSSDRPGGMGGEDLYRIMLDEPFRPRVRVSGRVLSKEDGSPLERVPVRLSRLDRTVLAQQNTKSGGRFEFIFEPQAVTIQAGIPGAGDQELPMDEHMLMEADGDLALEDIRLSTRLDIPITLRLLERSSGLPAPGVSVHMQDITNGRSIMDTSTDDGGSVVGSLRQVGLGGLVELELTMSHADRPTHKVIIPLSIRSGEAQVLEQEVDMGPYLARVAVDMHKSRFVPLWDEAVSSEGAEWAGRVIDRTDGQPVARVPVSLLDLRGVELVRTLTDVNGRYSLRSLDVPFTLLASLPGGDQQEIADISPFGDAQLDDIRVQSVMDLPVNALISDAVSGGPLDGVTITVKDRRDGSVLMTGITNSNGVCTGTIPDRRFGTEQDILVSFTKDGYAPLAVNVDLSVLAFLEQALGGPGGFKMTPSVLGLDIGEAMKLRPILFDYNSADIRSDAAEELDLVAQVMEVDTTIMIELRSHTDSRGGGAFNQFLSVRRAQNVRAYLILEGVAPRRLKAIGMGERHLLNHCADGVECSEIEHQTNRRTEFIVVADQSDQMVQRKP